MDATNRPPPSIPDYELLRPLGEGRFGTVWLARSRTDVHYAVKVVPKGDVDDVELAGLRTFEVLARRHPGLIEVRHVGEVDEALYCVMELADGYDTAPTFSTDDYAPRTLDRELERRGPLGLDEAVAVARSVADALGYLHEKGLLHRDVKPANVVFVGGVPKLADLGLVADARRRLHDAGTPDYMPPEGVVDASGDVYCLGKVLFEMVTGGDPAEFPALPDGASDAVLDAYRRIVPLIDRACAPEPSARFASAGAFAESLARLAPAGPGAGSGRRTRRLVALTLAAAVPLALLSLFGGRLGWLPTRAAGGEPVRTATVDGRLSLLLQPEGDQQSVPVDELQRGTPLPTEGMLWATFELSRPAYALIAYVDATGCQVLYPEDATAQVPVAQGRTMRFPLRGPEETLTFVLLAADEPFADPGAVVAELGALGAAPSCPPDRMLFVGRDGRVEALEVGEPTRGIDTARGSDVAPPPLAFGLLSRLHGTFGGRYALVRALAVPQVAGR